MRERISQIMQAKNMNASQFAEAVGIQRAAMSHIMAGRNNPSLDVITKILERFKTINPDWLLFGIGQMLRTDDVSKNANESKQEPDLFSNNATTETSSSSPVKNNIPPYKETTSHQPDNPSKIMFESEKNEGNQVKNTNNGQQITNIENITSKKHDNKSIEKIMIFYSDKTYETFMPETNR